MEDYENWVTLSNALDREKARAEKAEAKLRKLVQWASRSQGSQPIWEEFWQIVGSTEDGGE